MNIIKQILKIILKIIKFIIILPMLCMNPEYKYDIDKMNDEINKILK